MRKLYKETIKKGEDTPWGIAQTVEDIAPGIQFITTASHGGFKLSAIRRGQMPEVWRNKQTFAGDNWYEEDCDAALVVASFPQFFKPETVENCKSYLRKTSTLV